MYLSQQQIQMLHYLQQNQPNLTPPQQTLLQQLTNQYRMMQQYQARLQQRTQTPINQSGNINSINGVQQISPRVDSQQFVQQPNFQQQGSTRIPVTASVGCVL